MENCKELYVVLKKLIPVKSALLIFDGKRLQVRPGSNLHVSVCDVNVQNRLELLHLLEEFLYFSITPSVSKNTDLLSTEGRLAKSKARRDVGRVTSALAMSLTGVTSKQWFYKPWLYEGTDNDEHIEWLYREILVRIKAWYSNDTSLFSVIFDVDFVVSLYNLYYSVKSPKQRNNELPPACTGITYEFEIPSVAVEQRVIVKSLKAYPSYLDSEFNDLLKARI